MVVIMVSFRGAARFVDLTFHQLKLERPSSQSLMKTEQFGRCTVHKVVLVVKRGEGARGLRACNWLEPGRAEASNRETQHFPINIAQYQLVAAVRPPLEV